MLTSEDIPEAAPLWCVHIEGPDDVVPAPDWETAEKWAGIANATFDAQKARYPDPTFPFPLKAVALIWPHDAAGHAEGPSEEYAWLAA